MVVVVAMVVAAVGHSPPGEVTEVEEAVEGGAEVSFTAASDQKPSKHSQLSPARP